MTPERLRHLIDICKQRKGGTTVHYARVAKFLGVEPITLRRWLSGNRPIPRQTEIIMEILYFWPEVTAEAVNRAIKERDEAQKQY